jgi:hypothetical protein
MKKILALTLAIMTTGAFAFTKQNRGSNNGTLTDQPSKATRSNDIQEEQDYSGMSKSEIKEEKRKRALNKKNQADRNRNKKSNTPSSGLNTTSP